MSTVKIPYINELRRFIPDSFINGDDLPLELENIIESGAELHYYSENADDEFDFARLKMIVDDAIQSGESPPNTDIKLSERLHIFYSELMIDRKVLSNTDVWDFLTVFHCNSYARWRYPGRAGKPTPKTRYVGGNLGDNVLSRLWFIAEMTHDSERDDPYEITKQIANASAPQDTINFMVDTRFPNNKKVLSSIITFIAEKEMDSRGIQYLFPRMRAMNATVKCILLNNDEINNHMQNFHDMYLETLENETQ